MIKIKPSKSQTKGRLKKTVYDYHQSFPKFIFKDKLKELKDFQRVWRDNFTEFMEQN